MRARSPAKAGRDMTCAVTWRCTPTICFRRSASTDATARSIPQPAEMVPARAGGADSDRAEPRPRPSFLDRRRSGPVFRVHPRLGPHVLAGAAQHRKPCAAQGAGLRRRHVLFVIVLLQYRDLTPRPATIY